MFWPCKDSYSSYTNTISYPYNYDYEYKSYNYRCTLAGVETKMIETH